MCNKKLKEKIAALENELMHEQRDNILLKKVINKFSISARRKAGCHMKDLNGDWVEFKELNNMSPNEFLEKEGYEKITYEDKCIWVKANHS